MLLSMANISDNAPGYGNAKISETWPKPQGTKMNRVKEKETKDHGWCTLNTQEAEVGKTQAQHQPGLPSESEASLG